MANKVKVTLAHPMTAEQLEKLYADDPKDTKAKQTVTVPEASARALIHAGYAAHIDPQDHEAVRVALDKASTEAAAKTVKTTDK